MNINKLVPTISNKQLIYLLDNWIVNWIWVNWQNLEDLILSIIETTYRFNKTKSMSLLCDLRQLSYFHDIMYTFKLGFYYSNLWLAYKVYLLIDWDVWYRRIWVFIWIFLILNKFWKINYETIT